MFEIGKIYNRRSDIHSKYGGQERGGISTPAKFPYIFIFTGNNGEQMDTLMVIIKKAFLTIQVKVKKVT